jgi:hypothetical protein
MNININNLLVRGNETITICLSGNPYGYFTLASVWLSPVLGIPIVSLVGLLPRDLCPLGACISTAFSSSFAIELLRSGDAFDRLDI